jgi:hypothetical protein
VFDELLRTVRQIDGSAISIQLPLDEDRYLDRQCPSETCGAEFKVLFEDWRDKVAQERVFCPTCRAEVHATEWNTPEQSEHIRSVGLAHIRERMGKAMERDARSFNANQPRRGFIQMSLSVKRGAPISIVPVEAAAVLEQKVTCEACDCHYSSRQAAFFCPACGHNSATTTFDQTVQTVRNGLASLPGLRELMASGFGEQPAEGFARELLEQSLSRLVAAFQRLAEALFEQWPNPLRVPPRRNAFQNITEGSGLWRQVAGRGYDTMLSGMEMSDLVRLFQQRHLLQHREGIVDQDYITRSSDQAYSVGQRIVVREGDVMRLADLVVKLASGLRTL